MSTATTTAPARPTRTPGAVLLSRRGRLALQAALPEADGPHPATADGVTLLEADLVERGYLLSADLRDALAALDAPTLTLVGSTLLADVDSALGADRPHVPLFRSFPDQVPADTLSFFVDRVLAAFLQLEGAPCVLCGDVASVHPVDPCAHLVCRSCFDGAVFSACPICHRRLRVGDPFLRPERPRRTLRRLAAGPDRLAVLGLDTSVLDAAADELGVLLARTTAPSPQDAADLRVLLGTRTRADISFLPQVVPSRETKALVVHWLLEDPAHHRVTVPAAAALVDTATDVLRVLVLRSGGDAGLVDVPRFAAVPRPLRRAVLAMLDTLDVDALAQDLVRHRGLWARAAHQLHPLEHAAAFPAAAAAFAALRGTTLTGDALAASVTQTAATSRAVHVDGGRVSVSTHTARVETALAAGDAAAALALLADRPGELLRRLDHLLQLAAGDSTLLDRVVAAAQTAAGAASPAVLLSTLGAVRVRDRRAPRRVFFPKGGSAKAHIVPDDRPVLDAAVVDRVVDTLTSGALDRAAALPPAQVAVVDDALSGVIAPFATRTASRALVTLPRGSALPLPTDRTVRLFLHWMESDARVDLDLSAAFFTADWEHIGTCDYTSLTFHGSSSRGAVHSGDLTSAPAPLGASEFIDLDTSELAAAGVRYVVPVVFSYNNVAFTDMAQAFAGFMAVPDSGAGQVFSPGDVEQRFDLTGRARACVPMVLDLTTSTMRWVDVVKGVTGSGHAVHRHADHLAELGQALVDLFGSGARVSLGEVALWQAAARAGSVVRRRPDGQCMLFTRGAGESVASFAARVAAGTGADATGRAAQDAAAGADLAFVLRGDVELAAGAQVFALHPGQLDPAVVHLIEAADVAGALAPVG